MDKIDPGPGYRRLAPPDPEKGFIGELVQEGDDCTDGGPWRPSVAWFPENPCEGRQMPGYAYRRKLPVLPVPEDVSEIAIMVPSGPGPEPTVSPSPATPPARSESVASAISRLPDPNAPKPFTPNKYTRYIPTLDGRMVPVDVYCVSEAFDLGVCLKSGGALDAVNHARKKLLAPGQRGQKDTLQDIREAHASLGRAIALEEGAMGRETP